MENKETVLKKDVKGYGYKYTDLAGINEWLEQKGLTYFQEIETHQDSLKDYVVTHILKDDKEIRKVRGCEVVKTTLSKSNPAQEYGASITYCRRYSLLMALGLATEDDDAKCLDGEKKVEPIGKMEEVKPTVELITKVQDDEILKLLAETQSDVLADLQNFKKTNLGQLTKKEADTYIAILKKRISNKQV